LKKTIDFLMKKSTKVLNRIILFVSITIIIVIIFFRSCVNSDKASVNTTQYKIKPFVAPVLDTQVKTKPTAIINVGDGKSSITIDGSGKKYKPGTQFVIKPGTYANSINIQNLKDATIVGTGVILDGSKQLREGYYNCLNLSNLNHVVISGFTTQNNGYRMLNLNSRMVNLTLTDLNFNNNLQGIYFSGNHDLTWDGTDSTVYLLNCKILNSTFTNCGTSSLGGTIVNKKILNLIKNIQISGNKFTGGNPGNIISCGAVDGYELFNNVVHNVNRNALVDNRLFMMIGNGNVYNNKFQNYEGHAIGIWPVSFGKIIKTCYISGNTCTDSKRYAAFEFQEIADFNIPGLTRKANLIIERNTCGNLNTDHWKGFPGTFVDNYQFGFMGGKVFLVNNSGYNFFPVPVNNVLWNLSQPSVVMGNVYKN
jgi:hypothetical protein